MHTVRAKGILSANGGFNLYRGCQHGCIYCDARSQCYQMHHPFEEVEVKENAIELLEQALRRKKRRCMLSTGAMSDPYMPLEETLGYMRKALLVIEQYSFGINILTKSPRILRDLEILKRIHQKTKCVVQMTLTTYDETLCRKIEPNVAGTRERVEVLKEMRRNGIPTVVWLSPFLPFINDTRENIEGLLSLCAEAGVYGVICFGVGLTLREGNREYFYRQLDQKFPGIKQKYHQTYKNAYVVQSPKNHVLMEMLRERCRQYGILCDMPQVFTYLQTFVDKCEPQQLSFEDYIK